MGGLPDFHSPIDIALQSLNAANIDIIAQTLSTIKNDYRFGTATEAVASESDPGLPLTLVSLTGKGLILSGTWAYTGQTFKGINTSQMFFTYELDGDDHVFQTLENMSIKNLSNIAIYHPSLERLDEETPIMAGFLPGPITFESSFKLIIDDAGAALDGDIDITLLYAIAL